ncbi:hypothetical protein BDQ94DRAFT_77879 [Aspergillus welwitschiae]|uniref:Uncharacterized protein n=1 Tax=Aspergillus welwitschiae TaxID=1341132 RepID=A0A3F3PTU5_9EURO|nr:hypothetical protein BDQ94DRAFT_77879 [Aspergillus welwitschiae]RDH30248.1 hypothetical protein BDQ94DRAFT_77879 [Aspergillus welwitschiae]
MRLIGLKAFRCVLQGTLAPFPWLRRSPFFPNSLPFPFPRSLSRFLSLSLSPLVFSSFSSSLAFPLLLLFAACFHLSPLSVHRAFGAGSSSIPYSSPSSPCSPYPLSPYHLLN